MKKVFQTCGYARRQQLAEALLKWAANDVGESFQRISDNADALGMNDKQKLGVFAAIKLTIDAVFKEKNIEPEMIMYLKDEATWRN